LDRRKFLGTVLALPTAAYAQSFHRLWKQAGAWLPEASEATPVVWRDRLLAICFRRSWSLPNPVGIVVRDYGSGEILAFNSFPGGLGSAIVVNDVIHVFAATQWSGGNRIIHATLDENFKPSSVDVVRQYPDFDSAFNCSVCQDPTGFTLVVECSYGGNNFYHATDITGPWAPSGWEFNRYSPSFYAACPTIRWSEGFYYQFYLSNTDRYYHTRVARSRNLMPGGWEFSTRGVLYPDGPGVEGINASDIDFVEYNGQVHGVYFDGDQRTWGNTKRFIYPGTESQFLTEFF
jgi:hypothetical protein